MKTIDQIIQFANIASKTALAVVILTFAGMAIYNIFAL
jgi:hypothetical protein